MKSQKLIQAYYIPFEIQEEIIKRIPDGKSLIRFRSVSKSWKSLIHSSKFIADFNFTHTRPHDHLIVMYTDRQDSKKKTVSIVDDDSFSKSKVFLTYDTYQSSFVVSSQGLFCLYNHIRKPTDSGTMKVVVWNPTIRKSVDIVVPNVLVFPYRTVVGFGVPPHTSDPMLVKINCISHQFSEIDNISNIPWQVEVFRLSSRTWRSPSCSSNLPSKSIGWTQSHIVISESIYWLVFDRILSIYHIISFDMTKEEFTNIYLPDSFRLYFYLGIGIYKLREALVVLELDPWNVEEHGFGVWRMEHGIPNSFTKLFSISVPGASVYHVFGFRKSGEAIIGIKNGFGEIDLFLYEPCSKRINDIAISGNEFSLFVSSYMETLLLLDL